MSDENKGEILKQARLAAKLSQREVAEKVEMFRENYIHIEKGRRKITEVTFNRILKAIQENK